MYFFFVVIINKQRRMRKLYGGVLYSYCVNWEDRQIQLQKKMLNYSAETLLISMWKEELVSQMNMTLKFLIPIL